jgi:3-hydroxyacyl-CoA dehydrogenase
MEYRPREKWRFDSIGEVKDNADPAVRIRGILSADDRAARFVRPLMLDLLTYSARRVPEIADSPEEVDDAMRWGFNWALGPFQTWDALGVANVAEALQADGREVPPLVRDVLERGEGRFYPMHGGTRSVFVPATASYVPRPPRPSDLTAAALRRQGPAVLSNRSASLLDMGDGVALLEYHSKLNTIDQEIVALTREALDRGARDFRALVIGNDAADFSVGANLALLLMGARMRQWAQIERVAKAFQDVNMATKYSPVPVVVAAAGRTLGGGCEVLLHGARVRAAAELYCGLVETGVGLVPAGGGCKELLLRAREVEPAQGPFPPVRRAFETIAYATVSTSAAEARRLGYLRKTDGVTLDREKLLYDAKADAIALAEGGYTPPVPATIRLPGEGGRLALEQQIEVLRQAGKISAHDAVVAARLAYVLTGGDCSPLDDVGEQRLLDLEREAFLSLCGMPKTLERMQYTLTTGKPLRN